VLIRGGTSSVGLAAAALAVAMGATVLSTTRGADRLPALAAVGVAHPLVDDGHVAQQVRALFPSGVDGAIELVGTPTLPDTLAAVRVRGTVCFTGMLSNEWIVRDFYPIGYLPKGARWTTSGGPTTTWSTTASTASRSSASGEPAQLGCVGIRPVLTNSMRFAADTAWSA
jgi:NADPH:quinone reductase-like Zn-dependent oxidoreductase